MDPLRNSLARLGLAGHEARVYAALLEHSPTGAAVIARKCGLSRSSVYTTLQALVGKGLVGTTYRDEVKQFVVEGHGALTDLMRRELAEAQQRVALAEQLRDHFAALAARSANVPQVVYFEGQQGLKRIYLAMLREAGAGAEMRILRDEFIWEPAWSFVFDAPWRERVRRIKQEKGLCTRLLVNRSPAERARAAYYRSRKGLVYRFLPAKHPVQRFGLYLLGDIAAVLSVENNNLVGIKIVNRHLAANFDAMFESLWDTGSPPRR